MTNLILFVFGSIGFTAIMVDSTIMEPLRVYLKSHIPPYLYKPFECYQCMGFWTGLISCLILISYNPLVAIIAGCAGSFLSVASMTVLNYLEANSMVDLGDK